MRAGIQPEERKKKKLHKQVLTDPTPRTEYNNVSRYLCICTLALLS